MENNTNNRIRGKSRLVIILTLVTTIALSFSCGYFFHYLINGKTANRTNQIVKIMENAGYIYDPVTGERRDITEEDIADALVNAFLDEYSAYYTAEEYKAVISESKGARSGLGVVFHTTAPVITKVIGNSPAYKAGIRKGDKVLKVICGEEEITVNVPSDISVVFNGDYNQEITFLVERNGEQREFSFTPVSYKATYVLYYDNERGMALEGEQDLLERKIRVEDAITSLPSDTALIVLHGFEADCAKQLEDALSFMKENGKSKLILDLRYNGGGYMDVLQDVCSLLIYNQGKSNYPIAYAQGKKTNQVIKVGRNGFVDFLQSTAVIANEHSASATECLIGAMLHYGDTLNVNRLVIEKNSEGVARTYGKGIMQTTYELIGGGAFKLTTAQILWPDNQTCIHKKGIFTSEQNSVSPEKTLQRAIETLAE